MKFYTATVLFYIKIPPALQAFEDIFTTDDFRK
jgi:hypothetical protein